MEFKMVNQPHRPTIGLLIRGVSNEIGASLWAGVASVAAAHDLNLLTFAGGSLRFPHGFEAQGNVIYDLVDPELVDGLLLDGGDLGHYISPAGLQQFCQRYQGLPLVSIEVPLKGIPSVLVDFYQGMRQVIDHLIEVHQYRRIAFIRGPQESFTAEERYRAYRNALNEHALPFEPDLVVPGTFHIPSGAEGVKLLLDERQVQVEAIAAANDFMAVDAVQALQARRIRVPAEIAVVGFDDLEMARVVNPPLTTARLHNYERARLGTELLLAQLRGEAVPLLTTIPAELVVRQSCGCLSPTLTQAGADPDRSLENPWPVVMSQQRAEIVTEMVQAVDSINPAEDRARAEQLLAGFTVAIEQHRPDHGLLSLERILTQVAASGDEVGKWHGALTVLRRWLLVHLAEAETVSGAENFFQQARLVIGEAAERLQAQRRLQHERQVQTLSQIGQTVMTTFDTAELMNVVAQELPRLGMSSGYLSLYKNPVIPTEEARLILAFDETGRLDLELEERHFPAAQLAPPGMLPDQRRYSMIILPLYFRQDQLGFMILEVSAPDTTTYELLRGQISSALTGALLLQARQQADQALAKALAEVEQQVAERTIELQQEIAERSQVEAALRLSEERLKLALDAANDGLFDWNIVTNEAYFSPRYLTMLGYESDELPASVDTWQKLLHPDDRAYTFGTVQEYFTGKRKSHDIEVRMQTKAGGWRWILSRGSVIEWDEFGQPVRMVGTHTDIDARKQAEQGLRASEERYRQAVENSPNPIFSVDRYGIIQSWNRACERLFEYPGSDIIGQSFHKLLAESADRANFDHLIARVFQKQSLQDVDIAYRRRDGIPRFTMSRLYPVYSGEGIVEACVFANTDVTARVQAEQSLRERKVQLEALVENAPLATWSVDRQLRLISFNSAFQKTTRQVYGLEVDVGLVLNRLPIWTERYERGLSGERFTVEDSFDLGEQTFHTLTYINPIRSETGEVSGCLMLSQDITERRQIEDALRDSESRFRAIFEMAGVGVVLSTLQGKLLETNPVFQQMVGYTAEELKHMSVLDLTHPDDVAAEVQAVRTAISTQPAALFKFEKRYVHRNGRSIWARLTLSFISDNQGQPYYGLAVVENISEQKQSEEQLKAYAAELERSNRELQDFAYIASHDLQEPLRKIRAFGDRLQSRYYEQLDERGRDYLERMQQAVSRMQSLIQDLLTYSRVTTKAQPFTPVDVNDVVREVLSDLETRLEEVGGQVEVANLPALEADRTQMQQLFQNLISNALKFHKTDQAPRVRIEAELLPEPARDAQLCQITVQDNGIGFDEKYLDRIFGVFQRLHGRASYEGSGIGLAICRKIVERHGGILTARSKVGEGATFIVTLPVQQTQGGPQN